jgi:hypothetical protein
MLHLPPLRFYSADGCWDRTRTVATGALNINPFTIAGERASLLRQMPPELAFWHPASQSGTGAFQYRTGFPYTGTGLLPASAFSFILVPNWRMPYSLAFQHLQTLYEGGERPQLPVLLKITPCTLQTMKRNTPCRCTVKCLRWKRDAPWTLDIHTACGIHPQVHTAGGGKENTMVVNVITTPRNYA